MNKHSVKAQRPLQQSSYRQRWCGFKALLVLLVSCLSFQMHIAQAHEHAAKPQAQQGRQKSPERRAASKPTPHTPPKKEKPKATPSRTKPAAFERKIAVQHKTSPSRVQQGKASYYGGAALNGRLTASGERFNQNELTAAHPTLPFGTRIRVTNLSNQRQVVVRVNDRGPFVKGRILDVSTAAAQRMNMTGQGVAQVRVEVLKGEEVASSRTAQKAPVS
ncbi:septal ring lytic transglycosylase RlpA family protein [Zymobacter palmae]|uniref:Endolytic peptidoglycan transglycosylase RlpA n=1 Tax=Zymobacter palmae TaxID=33074 RepID=A0A348HD99_9GAMM|nr:septal ring lytic transglycosylase RlpA family protein [Zymobacter palmae]BBG29601.1 lipoprotein [Zymobacter palmae]